MNSDGTKRDRLHRRVARKLFAFVRNTLAVFGLLSIIYILCFELSVVVTDSMAPTLQGNGNTASDWLLCEKITYWFRSPRRWEIVRFRTSDHFLVAKRIVGFPGEMVSLRDKRVAINGSVVPPPSSLEFLRHIPYGNLQGGKQASCGDGYYTLGDKSTDSQDSRFEGPLVRSAITGRAWLIVWPLSRFGFVNP